MTAREEREILRDTDKRAQANYEHSQQLRITVCVHPAA